MSFDNLTLWFVLLGYAAAAVNSVLIARRTQPGWHRKVALLVIIPPAVFWSLFYVHIFSVNTTNPNLALWSRLGHTLTVGCFLAQQFMIQSAAKDLQDLEIYVQSIFEEPTDHVQ